MATSKNLAQGSANGLSQSGRRRTETAGPQAVANKTSSARAVRAYPTLPVATQPLDSQTKGVIGGTRGNVRANTQR